MTRRRCVKISKHPTYPTAVAAAASGLHYTCTCLLWCVCWEKSHTLELCLFRFWVFFLRSVYARSLSTVGRSISPSGVCTSSRSGFRAAVFHRLPVTQPRPTELPRFRTHGAMQGETGGREDVPLDGDELSLSFTSTRGTSCCSRK